MMALLVEHLALVPPRWMQTVDGTPIDLSASQVTTAAKESDQEAGGAFVAGARGARQVIIAYGVEEIEAPWYALATLEPVPGPVAPAMRSPYNAR
jgi:hypothetical protein